MGIEKICCIHKTVYSVFCEPFQAQRQSLSVIVQNVFSFNFHQPHGHGSPKYQISGRITGWIVCFAQMHLTRSRGPFTSQCARTDDGN